MYNLAAEIAAMPSTELIAPLNRAVYPAYAQLANAREKLLSRFIEIYGLIGLVAFPVAFGLFCLAETVVELLLGSQWMDAVPIMQILGLSGLIGALQGNMYVVMSAMGKPKANTLLSAALLSVSLPAVVWASLHYGALGASYAHLICALVGFGGIVLVFTKVTGERKRRLFSVMWRPFVASSFMTLAILIASQLSDAVIGDGFLAVRLFLLIGIGVISYSISIFVLWLLVGRPASAEREVLKFLINKFQSRNFST